jgi:hypothetical protein
MLFLDISGRVDLLNHLNKQCNVNLILSRAGIDLDGCWIQCQHLNHSKLIEMNSVQRTNIYTSTPQIMIIKLVNL